MFSFFLQVNAVNAYGQDHVLHCSLSDCYMLYSGAIYAQNTNSGVFSQEWPSIVYKECFPGQGNTRLLCLSA